jgi:uncharacterized protein YkwD
MLRLSVLSLALAVAVFFAVLPASLAGHACAHRKHGKCVATTTSTTTTQTSTTSTTSQTSPTPVPTLASSGASGTSTSSTSDQSDIDQYLSAHNAFRAKHGANPLTWNNTLASYAQKWVDACNFEHSDGPYGENLAAGTGDFGIDAAIKLWTDEASQYDPNNPQPSHFTQVVWKSSTQVGCAVYACNGIFDASFGIAQYYTCEYSPPGNYIGEFAQNVQV